jgi:DNA transformation protein
MASDPTFVAHVLDLLSLVGGVEARRMFGGHGLYAAGVMFGLLDDGELFLKTDAETRARFVAAGCRQWSYVHGKVRMEETSYFQPPDDAHEDPEAMLPWARLALDAALRVRAAKGARRGRSPGRTERRAPPPLTPTRSPRGAGREGGRGSHTLGRGAPRPTKAAGTRRGRARTGPRKTR